MISQIKLIKDIGVFKDYDSRRTGIEHDFGQLNLIYGFNTYGKSTLSEVFKDLSDDSCTRINHRITIPSGITPKAVIQLSSNEGTISIRNNSWNNNKLKGKVLVFDSQFIFDNVFDGSELFENRETKENFTDFILGDTGVKIAREIEHLKKIQKGEKQVQSQLKPKSQINCTETSIRKYAKTIVMESQETLIMKLAAKNKEFTEVNRRIKNAEEIKKYDMYSKYDLGKIQAFTESIIRIKNLLARSFQMNANHISLIKEHVTKNCSNADNAEKWIEKGIDILGEGKNCPFCGQLINDNNTIVALKEYFSDEYQKYIKSITQEFASIEVDWNIYDLRHHAIRFQGYLYKSSKVFGDAILENEYLLEELINRIGSMEMQMKNTIDSFKRVVLTSIESKKAIGYLKIDLDITPILCYKSEYEELLFELNRIIDITNDFIKTTKNEIEIGKLDEKSFHLKKEIDDLNKNLTRVKEDKECVNWLKRDSEIKERAETIKLLSNQLEQDQDCYLNNYFDTINQLFKRYGARKFSIEKGDSNNKGYKKVLGISVKFNGVSIDRSDSIGSFFSESDKRALALAVFMAKIKVMPEQQKNQIIVVLDDPVTSFDNNRIKSVTGSISDISRSVNQLFVLTHLVTFAEKLYTENKDCIRCFKIDNISSLTKGLFDMQPDEEFKTGFMKAFRDILKFNSGESDSLTLNDLRIFLEEYIDIVFAYQIENYGLNRKTFAEKISGLIQYGFIKPEIGNRLDYYRRELNSASHSFQIDTIEDDRNFSIDMIEYVFSKVALQ